MGKKIIQTAARRTSTRVIKKNQHPDDHYYHDDQDEQDNDSLHDDDSESDEDDDEESSEEEESSSPIPEEQLAVRNMQFRQRRGTKMNYLINRKKEEEEDPFWAQQGNQYFGDLDDGDNDQEDYVQSSSGRDQFDSDFDQTESDHQNQAQGEQDEQKEVDEDHQREKKKRQDLMRRIEAPAPPRRGTAKSVASQKQREKSDKGEAQAASRYIHMAFNQQQLLGQAATTEYYNWLSLKKLISIETQRKDFTRRSHHLQGPKVIYRDRINAQGKREQTYQLRDVQVRRVQELTRIMDQN